MSNARQGDTEFLRSLGLDVSEVGGRLVAVDENLGLIFLTWFSSSLGLELLDIRAVIIHNIPTKSTSLFALIDSHGPAETGQWVFAGDEESGYNLTFGIQLPREILTKEIIRASRSYLASFQEVGLRILQQIAQAPDHFPALDGASVWSKAGHKS